MSKWIGAKSGVVLLVLSVLVTYVVAIVEAFIRPSLGKGGFPLRFGTSGLFGEANTNYLILIVDIIFWFAVLFGIWKLLSKLLKKS